MLDKVLANIDPTSGIYVYGVLEAKPFTISDITLFFKGIEFNGFLVFPWLTSIDAKTKSKLKENYKKYIEKELATKNGLTVTLKSIQKGLDFAKKNPADGKSLVIIGKNIPNLKTDSRCPCF